MLVRLLAGIFAVSLLTVSCVVPLGTRSGAQITFVVTVPSGLAAGAGSRLVAPESTSFRVTDKNPLAADEVVTVPAVLNAVSGVTQAKVSLTATLGTHSFLVEALDANLNVLTQGQTSAVTVTGDQQLSLTLTPAVALAAGNTINLAANQVGYYTVPLGSSLTMIGSGTTFWALASDGSFSGTGLSTTITVGAPTTDQYIRAVQGPTAGSFSVVPSASTAVTIDFSVPKAPLVSANANQLYVDGSPFTNFSVLVNPQLSAVPTLTFVKWTIDGLDTYPDATTFSVYSKPGDVDDGQITIDPKKLSLGTHEVVVYLTDGTHIYTANITFYVVHSYYPS